MDIINTNRIRVSVRRYRRGYGERVRDFSYGTYNSSDHGKPCMETNFFLHVWGIVANMKYRPDGKYSTARR